MQQLPDRNELMKIARSPAGQQLMAMLQQWVDILEESFACRAGGRAVSELARTVSAGRSSAEILAAIRQLQKCLEYAQGNVSPAAICGYLQWALR